MRKATESSKDGVAPIAGGRKYLFPAAVFIVAFVLAFALAWRLFGRGPGDSGSAAPVLTGTDLREFLRAADAGDIDAMTRLGNELFQPGRRIGDRKRVLAGYETTSYPPYDSYAFFAGARGKTLHRILLTVDADDRVAAFLAEETALAE